MKKRITKCPHCGSDYGMCIKFKAGGTDWYDFNGKFQDSEIVDYYSYNKFLTCCDCGKRIMSFEEFKRDYFVAD